MSDVYTPSPVRSISYTRKLDGDNGDVASDNPWLQALSDMAAYHEGFVGAWTGAIGTSGAVVCQRGTFSNLEQAWYAVGSGGSDVFQRSQDYGRSWANLTAALGGGALGTLDIACKQSTGDLVIINLSRNVYKGVVPAGAAAYGWAGTGGNWTNSANALSAAPSAGQVDYEVTAGKYIALYRVGATGMRVDWDADGIAPWTAGTLPTGWAAYAATTQDPALTCIPGRAMAVFFDDTGGTNIYRIAYSTDGGATWTGVTKTPTSFNPATVTKPAYDSVSGKWFIAGAITAGGRKTEVWSSSDSGATWTSVANLTSVTADMALQDIVAINGRLVGVNDDGRIYASEDAGVTWKLFTRNPITSAARPYLRGGGGGLMVWNSADKTTYTTLRFGGLGQVVA